MRGFQLTLSFTFRIAISNTIYWSDRVLVLMTCCISLKLPFVVYLRISISSGLLIFSRYDRKILLIIFFWFQVEDDDCMSSNINVFDDIYYILACDSRPDMSRLWHYSVRHGVLSTSLVRTSCWYAGRTVGVVIIISVNCSVPARPTMRQ